MGASEALRAAKKRMDGADSVPHYGTSSRRREIDEALARSNEYRVELEQANRKIREYLPEAQKALDAYKAAFEKEFMRADKTPKQSTALKDLIKNIEAELYFQKVLEPLQR